MSNIRSVDMLFVDDLFEMHSGYVLDFSDRTFAQFFAAELNVDIDDPAYKKYGTSKARRFRCFLQTAGNETVIRSLNALWEYREATRRRAGRDEEIKNARGQLLAIINRINSGETPQSIQTMPPRPTFNVGLFEGLRRALINLSAIEPQKRGYAFESFLKTLFDEFGLQSRDPFRLKGEQIDGSFLLGNETYLLEAKWQNGPSGADHLHTFHGKIEQKAAWTRGLFISYSGFSEIGLHAFGRGKRVICMDGYDLVEALERALPINIVLEHKVRRAAETGLALVRVRDLFPN